MACGKEWPGKYPVIRMKSDRVDVEVIGPSETMDLETECGSGLCQQLAGDFLFHCHVAHHYIAGMWGYWRVYNTLQQGEHHNDVMPDLRELPDRTGPYPSRYYLGSAHRPHGGLVRKDVHHRQGREDELEGITCRRQREGLGQHDAAAPGTTWASEG